MVMFMYLTPLIIVRKGEMNLFYYYHTEQNVLNSNYITIDLYNNSNSYWELDFVIICSKSTVAYSKRYSSWYFYT